MAIRPPTSRGSSYDLGTPTIKWNAPMATKITAKEKKELLEMDDQIADRIREASETRNITNRELAKQMDVAERTVNDWKANGQVSRKNIPLLCKVLDCSVGWLMTGEEDGFQERKANKNVVEFQRPLISGHFEGRQLTTRYVPVLEDLEIAGELDANAHRWEKAIADFVEGKKHGATCTVPYLEETPGVPTFAVQNLAENFVPALQVGQILFMATDIVPFIGNYVMYAIKPEGYDHYALARGFFSPINCPYNNHNLAHSYYNHLKEFVLQNGPNGESHPTDIHVSMKNDNAILIGVLTFSTQWHTFANRWAHTPIFPRFQDHMRNRIRRDSDT